jgi:hypothetical protein
MPPARSTGGTTLDLPSAHARLAPFVRRHRSAQRGSSMLRSITPKQVKTSRRHHPRRARGDGAQGGSVRAPGGPSPGKDSGRSRTWARPDHYRCRAGRGRRLYRAASPYLVPGPPSTPRTISTSGGLVRPSTGGSPWPWDCLPGGRHGYDGWGPNKRSGAALKKAAPLRSLRHAPVDPEAVMGYLNPGGGGTNRRRGRPRPPTSR